MYSGTQIDLDNLKVTYYNIGRNKLTSLSMLIHSNLDALPQKIAMLIGDESNGGDQALLSLNTICFARQKGKIRDYTYIPDRCVWTSWEELLENRDDITLYHEKQMVKRYLRTTYPSFTSKDYPFPDITDIELHTLRLWNYHQMSHKIKTEVDGIIVLGSYDLTVVDSCVELYHKGISKTLLFTGKFGNWTKNLWKKTAAEVFSKKAISLGVDNEDILIEKEATNIGENIRFSSAILKANDIDVKTMIIVTKPNTERRAYATCKKVWPEVEAIISSPRKNLMELNSESLTSLINEMVGDLHRIIHYPERGYQIDQEIPHLVKQSYNYLIKRGYTKHLQDKSTLTGVSQFAKLLPR